MFSHIQLGVRDLTRMQQFYDSVLAELGLVRVAEERVGEAGVIWRRADRRWSQFVLRAPLNGLPATWVNGSQVSFAAPSPDAAAVWSVALTLGAINEGEPGLRPQYAPDFYGASFCCPRSTFLPGARLARPICHPSPDKRPNGVRQSVRRRGIIRPGPERLAASGHPFSQRRRRATYGILICRISHR
ncbi:hypothetical protein [Candidatus Sodalis pierantonius]|uniref:hypothetical protein n=1 Tax=Candidatus Sodalis pierantonii TaxID=1486991 RepID=UPI00046D0BCB|nr:hypothetical protein [Candidatus Sodalis pierantonius]